MVDKDPVTDVVLIHGYAASLGLFIDNFDLLSSAPGIKIHAIDLLGFGFSSRPKFPSFPSETKGTYSRSKIGLLMRLRNGERNVTSIGLF